MSYHSGTTYSYLKANTDWMDTMLWHDTGRWLWYKKHYESKCHLVNSCCLSCTCHYCPYTVNINSNLIQLNSCARLYKIYTEAKMSMLAFTLQNCTVSLVWSVNYHTFIYVSNTCIKMLISFPITIYKLKNISVDII